MFSSAFDPCAIDFQVAKVLSANEIFLNEQDAAALHCRHSVLECVALCAARNKRMLDVEAEWCLGLHDILEGVGHLRACVWRNSMSLDMEADRSRKSLRC